MEMSFEKTGPLRGSLSVPGDKSVSHRAAIVGALSRGVCRIGGYSVAADCSTTLEALAELGVEIRRDGEYLLLRGRSGGGFQQPDGPIYAGNSGTTMRLLAGALASMPIDVTMTGDESLLRRPMLRVVEPLNMMGARLELNDEEGRPPLRVRGGRLKGIDYPPPIASAQVKSAVLLAGLGAEGETSVREVVATRDHTERMLELMGISVKRKGLGVTVEPGIPEARDLDIPGDVSSAAFLVTAALVCPGSQVEVHSVGLNPTRTGFLGLLLRMGADIETIPDRGGDWEPRGTIIARYAPLEAIDLRPEDVALAIDEVTLIALLATGAEGRTEIIGASELRHKESDRIRGTVEALRAMGARIEETPDGMTIDGPSGLDGARVSANRDHRLAMMLALAGLAAEGRTVIEGWEWTSVSYPGFESALAGLGAKVF